MRNNIIDKLFVLAFCITTSFCLGQQNRSAICNLGEITNDSLLPYITSMEIDCKKDVEKFIKKAERITTLSSLTLKGDAKENNWSEIFQKLKTTSSLRTVIFDSTTFQTLPYGYEGLYYIENIVIQNNEELEYPELIKELSLLPNLKEITFEIVTIYDLPADLSSLKNITKLTLINTDEYISKNDTSLITTEKESKTYDFSVKNKDDKTVAIKYVATAGEIDSDEYKELSKRFTTSTNFRSTQVAFIPKYININPPIKGIDVERTNYIINPQIENIVTYPSGTKIFIPANAFVDKNGNSIKTTVTLSYREFRDPVDILVSGIPMKYDTGGVVTNFESAGMFELNASTNSEPLNLSSDKKIDMNFATTSKDSTYNFYAYNDSTGNWDYLNKPKTVTSQTIIKLNAPTKAFQLYKSLSRNNTRIYDSTKFAGRFADTNYVYTHIKNKGATRIYYRSQGQRREKSIYSLVKISNVKKAKDGTVLFKVSSLSTSHPEMIEFNNLYFALNENMTPNQFKQKYGKRKYYNDVRVTSSGGDVAVELKDSKSIRTISANLATLSKKGEVVEITNVNTQMKHYNKRLRNRERQFNRQIAKGKLDNNDLFITDPQQLKKYAFGIAQKSMTKDEKKMSFNEWVNYCKQTEDNERAYMKQVNAKDLAKVDKELATSSNLIQSLSLEGMGIFNCDQIQRLREPVEIFASYKTSDSKKINPESSYILDKNSNSVLRYDGMENAKPSLIGFSKSIDSENTLIAVNKDGSLAIYKSEEFRKNKFSDRDNFQFELTKIESKLTSVGDLKSLIGF